MWDFIFFPLGFPRKPEKDDHGDEEDRVVEDIEEQFGKSTNKERKPRAIAGVRTPMQSSWLQSCKPKGYQKIA